MLTNIRKIFAPPIFEDDERTRVAALLNNILWAVIIIGTAYAAIAPFILEQYISALLAGGVAVFGFISRFLMKRGFVQAANITLLTVLHVILTISVVITNGTYGAVYFGLLMTTVMAGVLAGGRGAYTMAVINGLTALVITIYQDSLPPALIPQSQITYWSSLIVYLLFVASLQQASYTGFEKVLGNLRKIQVELTNKNRELEGLSKDLESRVASRTAELNAANQQNEKRARQFEAISRVSQAINKTQNLQDLLPQIAQVISHQFDFYHIGIFLADLNREYAVLSATNSEGGTRMLEKLHKLRIGQTGIVGNVAKTGKVRIALDTGSDAIYFNNPDLPDTRSEIALPLLQADGEIIGVLDIQSTTPNAFKQEDIEILATLADQVSVAIVNARLYEETQKALIEAEMIYRQELKTGWEKFSRSQKLAGIRRRGMKTSFLAEPLEVPGIKEVIQSGEVYKERMESSKSTHLTIPVKLRGEAVGILNLKAGSNREWSADEMDIINAIVERAALAIENARLLDESRRIAERERAISDISSKIGKGTEIETILRTAVRELGSQISGAQVTVEIGGGDE
ncbi:MAG: GAF domain-containing protein [Anaerolineales bacterium]|nr:GAF domain-containing protein [Anaerolineales bacterium]